MASLIGETLGSYKVLRVLGQGGMGQVFLAEHPLIGKRAAVKVLLPQYSNDPEIVNRFFNEARSATLIRHPGIVEIFDFGHHANGSAYIIMEYLEGESLGDRLKRERPLSIELTVEVARQVAGALGAAHQKGIVHRDLKPDNVYLVNDSDMPLGIRTKLLDFGIAKLSSGAAAAGVSKTRTGMMMGTPLYMSPEQCRGAGSVDHRADIYSLGCMIFEMCAGRLPFVFEGPGEIIAAHIFQPPPALHDLVPGVPPVLDQAVARALAKQADQRYASAFDLARELDAVAPRSQSARLPQV
jgi:serine/threonine-protein kinase